MDWNEKANGMKWIGYEVDWNEKTNGMKWIGKLVLRTGFGEHWESGTISGQNRRF